MKTMKELAQEAIDVQDASNLSGVVHSWSRAINDLWDNARAGNVANFEGTATINRHPINVLYADKVASLTGTQGSDATGEVSMAYDAVHALAQ